MLLLDAYQLASATERMEGLDVERTRRAAQLKQEAQDRLMTALNAAVPGHRTCWVADVLAWWVSEPAVEAFKEGKLQVEQAAALLPPPTSPLCPVCFRRHDPACGVGP